MTSLRILFVDDEAAVLDGLRDLLRKHRKVWDMSFALGAEPALAQLAEATFDVIVTDMRMPGMDGAELLERVQAKYPAMTRIVLSGDAERDAVIRALPVAHQYLAKPCDGEVLRQAIERAGALRTLLDDPALRRVVGQLTKLPSIPRTFSKLTQAMANPASSICDIAAIVETDAAMSAKVLQLANSAYFGPVNAKTTVGSAVAYLGVEMLKAMALTAHLFAAMDRTNVAGFSLERLQAGSLEAARLTRRFLPQPQPGEQAFAAALLRDIGQVVLAIGVQESYEDVVWLAKESSLPIHEVELDVLGVTHQAVGAYLLGVWGLPLSIVSVVANHHTPAGAGPENALVMAAVHVATSLAPEAVETRKGSVECPVDMAWIERAGLLEQVAAWRALAAEPAGQPPRPGD